MNFVASTFQPELTGIKNVEIVLQRYRADKMQTQCNFNYDYLLYRNKKIHSPSNIFILKTALANH